MTYEAWRIQFQDSEQAARSAYSVMMMLQKEIEALSKERDRLAGLQISSDQSLGDRTLSSQ